MMEANVMIMIFLLAVVIIGGLLFVVIVLTKKGSRQLDVNKYRMQWMKIEQVLTRDELASHQLTVLQADKLLDRALREKGVAGATMGERMKSAQTTWSNANAVWGAHKLRNEIAHNTEARVSYDDARRALAGFKRGLKDLGAI